MAKKKVKVSDDGLEELINDLYNSCLDDVEEANLNVNLYKTEVLNNTLGKESYGTLLSDALKIKGAARDRIIKVVNLVKDRVKSKEFLDKSTNQDDMSPENIVKGLDMYLQEDEDGDE